MDHQRMKVVAAIIALAISGSCTGQAQEFPNKLVRITSPFAAGTGPDVVMRMFAEKLTAIWKQPVIVEARAGGSGIVAMNAVKSAPADGHDLVLVSDAHVAINPALYKNLSYDPQADFAPVTRLYSTSYLVVAASNGAYKNVADVVADARLAPNKVSYGIPAVGSPAHLGAVLLESMTGTKMLRVPFKGTQ